MLSGEILFHFPTTITGHMSVIVCVIVSEYLKRKNRYEKYQIRKELELTQRNLQTILDSFPDGLVVLNNDLMIVYNNHKILQFMNCGSQNLIKVLKNITYIDNRRNYLGETNNNLLMRDIENSRYFEIGKECILGLSDISNQIYKWKLKKVLWEGSESILLTCLNITKAIELEKKYVADSLKTSIIKSFSHELKTPISEILKNINLSIESNHISKEVYKYLQFASIYSKQLFSQVNNILDLSNILCEKFNVIKESFNLRDWVSENLENFKLIAEEKNISFDIYIDKMLPSEIYTDSNRLKQVIYCFINNSLKFTFKGKIKISLKLTGDFRMKFEIIDTGTGIQNEKKTHLLQLFSGTSKAYDSGIGLYVSKLILGYIGCDKIFLQSTVGYGTEFSFAVDIKLNQARRKYSKNNNASCEESLNPLNINKENYDILIVDDNELSRKMLISTLKGLRPMYLEAENGQEAVEIIKRFNDQNKHIKVIIMDIDMPIMDGWEASRAIKDMERKKIIDKPPHIIGYMTYSSEEDIDMCYQCGMSYCLTKPITPTAIFKIIKYYLKHS